MKNENMNVWNISINIDNKLYVLDEKKKGNKSSEIIRLLLDNITLADLRPMDKYDKLGFIDHDFFGDRKVQ